MLKTLKLPLVALALVALVAIPAMAKPAANVEVTTAGLTADPTIEYSGAELTVTGKHGFSASKSFAAGEAIDLGFDGGLADGKYKYELVFAPVLDEATRASLAAARETGELVSLGIEAQVQSGSFTVKDGAVVNASLVESLSTKDIQHLDDVIITFSLCVGNDCVNGESFGFDTVRLKENNLRIHFDDTSNSSSFPKNDWRIVINDSSNGGDEYFRIEDSTNNRTPFQIDAGAPSNSLRVDSAGDVGLGTSNPIVDLHIVSGNTPTVRLEQNGSSGFTPQTFDIAGNEANFFIRDVTNGSTLPFKIKPGAPTSSIFVAASGDIGLGTESPGADLHVHMGGSAFSASANTGFLLQNTAATNSGSILTIVSGDTGNSQIALGRTSGEFSGGRIVYSNNDNDLAFYTNGTENMTLDSSGNLNISGGLTTTGATCSGTPCDGVFHADYSVPSIEEHAAFMWENSYLPAVGPTLPDQPFNLTQKTTGMLNELEKAHIYIEQLNDTVKKLEQRLAELEAQK